MTISKFAPKREKDLIQLSDIKEELFLIPETEDYYVTKTGKFYRDYKKGFYPLKTQVLMPCGYEYITWNKKNHRVHRILAQMFIPNPNNFPIVGHKDNNKLNNNLENLYWTTYSENSQKAVDDGLLVNTKSWDDNQSIPVICYDYKTKKELYRFGSVSEAHRELNVSKSTVLRQCRHEVKTSKCGYWFKFLDSENL